MFIIDQACETNQFDKDFARSLLCTLDGNDYNLMDQAYMYLMF